MVKQYIKKNLGSILFYLLVVLFILYGFVSITIARSNAIAKVSYSYEAPEGNVNPEIPSSYKKIAVSENIELYFDEGKGNIQVKNTDTGYIWKGIVDDEMYPVSKLNKQWSAYLQSMFTISYNDVGKRDAPPSTVYAGRDCDYIEVNYLENGVEVKYGFTEVGLFATFQYVLKDGNFIVRIPHEGFEEHLQYCITTLEVLPFFGSAGNDIDGYLFYPDGSGAISSYENTANRTPKVKQGILRTYSNKKVTIEEYYDEDNYERYVAGMPVFGIKNNENAMFAAATDGAEETGIITYPSGIVVDLNRINFEVYVRNVFDVDMFNVTTDADTTSNGKEIQRVDENIIKKDREFTYFFLSGNQANYSKMADVYRNYLIEENLLKNKIEQTGELPLALEFLMGVTESQMVFDKYIKMTSFEDLENILERLNDKGIKDAKVLLTSWQKDGVNYPKYWPVAKQIGGAKGLKTINEYVKENTGIDIFFENNFTFARERSGGFSTTDDIVYSGVNIPVTAGITDTWYLLNPQVAYNRSMDFVDKLSAYENIGVGYQFLGRMIYPDYNKEAPFTRGETAEKWKKIYKDTREQGKKTATEGLNQYAYEDVDYLYSVPLGAYGLAITDYSVPFIQMVISGMIPYSSKAGNLSYDLDIQKLQWIEYGALPYFNLTYEDAVLLKETSYNHLFTSTYDKWEERVVSVYSEFNENFGFLYGKQMLLHEILAQGVVRVGYEEGTMIYLNYNNNDIQWDGFTIPAKGYRITSWEGK
jgi:hypothetical protein